MRSRIVVLAIILCVLLPATGASAAAGDLDLTFGGGDGWMARLPKRIGGQGGEVAVQPDGRIVSAIRIGDDIGVVRLMPDGTPDRSFGDAHGRVRIDFRRGSTVQGDLELMPDGRIVVVGTMFGPEPSFQMVLVRLLASGLPDPSFSGDGRKVILPNRELGGSSVTVLDDGSIVAAGTGVVKVTPTGQLDGSFGHDGVAECAGWLEPLADGRFVIAQAVPGAWRVHRLLPDGTLDVTFGESGEARVDWARGAVDALLAQPDGKLVLIGDTTERPRLAPSLLSLARFTSEGALDPTFGGDGKRRPQVVGHSWYAIVSGDEIYAAGSGVNGNTGLSLARVRMADGRLDLGFGDAGVVTFAPIAQFQPMGFDSDAEGRLIVSAFAVDDAGRTGYGLARFLG